jgi:hypothetical protein
MKYAVLALIIYLSYTAANDVASKPKVVYDCDCVTTYEKVYEGNFQNKNQYMQNPYVNCTDSVTRFATTSVTINDTIQMKFDDFNSSAFEIPLKDYHFKVGDAVRIVVKHYGCGSPKMLNPEVYKPQ